MENKRIEFSWSSIWCIIMLILAAVMCISQAVKGSWPGACAFFMIAYVYYRLMRLEK